VEHLTPRHWRWQRIKNVSTINRLSLPEDTDPEYEFDYIDVGAVTSAGTIGAPERLVFEDAPSRARRLVNDGDTIVSTVRTYLRAIAQITEDASDIVVSTGFATVTPGPDVDPRFIFWWLRSTPSVEEIVARSVGVSYPAVNASDVGDIGVAVPPIEEQRRIAGYLDAEAARIDGLVEEEQRLLALTIERAHNAQRQLAVEGCRPAAMRRTGATWITDIPDHWRMVRLKYEAKLESGHTPSRTQPGLWEDCKIPWISLNDVGQLTTHEYISETVNMISEAGLKASSARILPAGTVVVSRDATIGRCSIMAVPMATSQHFADWVCGPNLEPRYLWLLFTTAMQDYFDSLTDGATLRTIGMPDIRALTIPLPPLAEQHEIVSEAESVRVAAQQLIEELSIQIKLLQERRYALIVAAVTGQLESFGSVA
jgi:type I restriction enzyme, S subunit